jgi:hypothetical protein
LPELHESDPAPMLNSPGNSNATTRFFHSADNGNSNDQPARRAPYGNWKQEIQMILRRLALALTLVLCGLALSSPTSAQTQGETMQKYVIERDIPGAGRMSPAELNAASKKSREALASTGSNVQWVQSYVTDDKLYCVYLAHNEDDIRRHAKAAGIPATRISAVKTILDPTNGN